MIHTCNGNLSVCLSFHDHSKALFNARDKLRVDIFEVELFGLRVFAYLDFLDFITEEIVSLIVVNFKTADRDLVLIFFVLKYMP